MSIRIRRLSAIMAFALALTSLPATSSAYPMSLSPFSSTTQTTVADNNPLRTLLEVLAQETDSLWAALDSLYSDAYVATACDQPC